MECVKTSEFSPVRRTSENFDVFNRKKVNFLFISFFLEDLRLINQPCFKPINNTIKKAKEYL